MKTLIIFSAIAVCALNAGAAEFFVSPKGDDAADGSAEKPWRTIQRAADVAAAGDVVTIRGGVYREWVKPANAGREGAPITYRAAKGEKVVVTGTDPVTGWTRRPDGLWTAKVRYDSFGGMNPFTDFIFGDWFSKGGSDRFRTRLIQDGKPLELHGRDMLIKGASSGAKSVPPGHAVLVSGMVAGTIVAAFEKDPNVSVPELIVRPACFYPAVEHRDYITLRGITFRDAGPNWAPPTSEQAGIVGTNWSRGWVIEDCEVSGTECSGITLGKYGDEWDNVGPSAANYHNTIMRCVSNGLDRVGHHTVRRCRITDCGQAGICGSLGAVFSTIDGCDISYCHWKKPYGGAEMGGIKIHAAVDFTISNCRIHHCGSVAGIWFDWMGQGARVVGNTLWANSRDLFFEVDHGPILVEGNDFLSDMSFTACSHNVALVGNRIRGKYRYHNDKRRTPIFKPHSVTLDSLAKVECGNGNFVFINNILANDPSWEKEAHPSRYEDNWMVPGECWKVDDATGACEITPPADSKKPDFKPVDTKRLGRPLFVDQAYPEPSVILDKARLAEIERTLPEAPRADGAPASDRAKWDPLAASDHGRLAVKNAAKISGAPVPDTPDDLYLEFSRNGNRSNYQKCYFRRKSNFVWLYVGECLERKGRFIPKIVEYMDAFCAMKSWTLPAHDADLSCFKGTPHIDLCSAELSRELAFCLSWLGDAIPAATREKVIAEIDRRTFQPHLAHARGERKVNGQWWFHGGNNWNSVCNSCVVRAALALIPDRRLRAEFVLHAEGSVPFALAGYSKDGYCSEGMGYWNYGYGHHVRMGLSLRAATGGKVDLFANPKTKTVMEYAYGFQLQNGKSPHFADGGGNPSPELLALGRQVWPDLVSTAALKAPVFGFDTSTFSLRAFGQEPAPCEPTMDVLPARTWFPDAQVLISRRPNNDGRLDWSVAIKGGHNAELHNHNDVGSYTIMMDGVEMCGDPGGEVYTRRTFSRDRYVSKMLNSYAHPVPVVGGRLQKGGRKAAAKILKTDFTDAEDTVVIDCTAAYDVPALKSLVRTMVFNRAKNTVTITDKVAFGEPTAFEVPVVTYRDYEKGGDGMNFSFKKPSGRRTMSLNVSATAPISFSQEEVENPGRPSPRRLLFSFEKPVLEGSVTAVFRTR